MHLADSPSRVPCCGHGIWMVLLEVLGLTLGYDQPDLPLRQGNALH
jgi:hypothetical protein